MARPKAARPKETESVRKSPRSKARPAAALVLPTRKPAKIAKLDPPAKRGRKKADGKIDLEREGKPPPKPSSPTTPRAATLSHSALVKTAEPASALTPSEVVTEADILAADTLDKVVAFVNLLVGSQQQLFDRYKHTARLQMDADARLIAELRRELENKQTSIDALLALLQRAQTAPDTRAPSMASSTPQRGRAAPEMYELPIRGRNASLLSQHELAGELKTIGVTLDMLELLTGVRIISYEEDRAKFYFDVKQLSTTSDNDTDAVSVVYRLVIKRKFELTAEVTYVPSFLQTVELNGSEADDARAVAACLPEYLKDNLIFPYNTLLQFYAKMSKALNRSAKR